MHLTTRTGQLSILFLTLVLALAALTLSWPRLQASYRFLPVDIALDRYYQDREIASHRLLTLIGFAEQAVARYDHYRYHDGLSLLHYLRGLDQLTPALQRRDAYRQAEAEAIETVRRAPLQPQAWLRIATIRALLHDEPETVLAPWKMSVLTGRTHSTLVVARVGVGLPYLGFMDGESRSMLRDQLLLAWSLKPAELLRELQRRDPALAGTRALLGTTDSATLAEIEDRIETAR